MTPIETGVFAAIDARLRRIEADDQVRVLFAVESGSRAWGFPSRDSDYDVRFIYIHRPEWYLSIDSATRRDVIEMPIEELLDISGWDVPKALRLLNKSNPPLLEWLSSSIVYRDELGFAESLRALAQTYASPRASAWHYLHMAQGNFREYLRAERVWLKKYLYVLRPLLAVRWVEQGRGAVPMQFSRLLVAIEGRDELIVAIEELVRRKRDGDELDEAPAIPAISDFIGSEMQRLESFHPDDAIESRDREPLNELFRELLRKAW